MKDKKKKPGKVYITGAGPGDPGLLTVKAYNLIKKTAEVVVYDRLVPNEILEIIPSKIKKIYVGKSCKDYSITQSEINEILVREARLGKNVIRLKGGDPMIFSRLGEEMEFLVENQVDFEIIPGITSASGCAAIAGIPLTHRGIAGGVRFITGHRQKGGKLDLDWKSLADLETTLVVYMGLTNLRDISVNLIKAGLPATTPVAAIQEGTTSRQCLIFSSLQKIHNDTIKKNLKSPVLLIIGNVVNFAEKKGNLD